eukprot:jgi/Bigna1/91719/estExt_fgenesh1_pg.C_1150003
MRAGRVPAVGSSSTAVTPSIMLAIAAAIVASPANVKAEQDLMSFELSIECMKELVAAGILEHETSSNFNSERRRGWHMFVPSGGTYRYHLSCQANPQFSAHGGWSSRDGYLQRCHLTARRVDEYWRDRGRHSGEPGEAGVAYACDVRSPCIGPFCPFSYFSRKRQRNQCYEQLEGISMAISSCLKCNVENSKGSMHLSSSSSSSSVFSSLLSPIFSGEAGVIGTLLWGVAGAACGIIAMNYLRRASGGRRRGRGKNRRNKKYNLDNERRSNEMRRGRDKLINSNFTKQKET